MTTDITELAQRADRIISEMKLKHGDKDTYAPIMKWDEFLALVEALEKAQRANAAQDDHINQQQDRINKLEEGCKRSAKRINSWRRLAKQSIAEQEKCVNELDAARQRIVELDRKNCELDSLTQRWAVERAENAERIAELESRTVTVKLPEGDERDDLVISITEEIAHLQRCVERYRKEEMASTTQEMEQRLLVQKIALSVLNSGAGIKVEAE
ncbi:TPA: hypothetical protein LVK80_001571 [Klebsiella michiganensis]|nr:hypothetical protein [Klebsiella michiganensis]